VESYLRFKGTRGVGGYMIQSATSAIGPIISDAVE
jgi:hypothetical protein